ncbi:tail fiber domain-containing protein [Deinococcus sp. PEB2-67]
MSIQTGNPNAQLNVSMVNLETTDYALPGLWDPRYKQLLDNDAVLNKNVTQLASGQIAVRRLQSYPSAGAMRAATGLTDGETAYLEGRGLYRYYAAAVDAPIDPFVLQPDQGAAGRWKLEMIPVSQRGQPRGIATLNAQGFLEQAPGPGTVTVDGLANDSVTDAKLATVQPNDNATPNGPAAKPGTLLSWLANRLKAITGQANWTADPPVSLAVLNDRGARIDRTQTFTQSQTFTNGITVGTGGINFPDNPFGGSGDKARLYVAQNTTDGTTNPEACALIVESQNDVDDIVLIRAGALKVQGQTWSTGGFYQASRRDLKDNIHPYEDNALDLIAGVQVVRYRYLSDATGAPHIGIIAEDTHPDLSGPAQNTMMLGNCVGVLLRAVQELTERNDRLERRIQDLEG